MTVFSAYKWPPSRPRYSELFFSVAPNYEWYEWSDGTSSDHNTNPDPPPFNPAKVLGSSHYYEYGWSLKNKSWIHSRWEDENGVKTDSYYWDSSGFDGYFKFAAHALPTTPDYNESRGDKYEFYYSIIEKRDSSDFIDENGNSFSQTFYQWTKLGKPELNREYPFPDVSLYDMGYADPVLESWVDSYGTHNMWLDGINSTSKSFYEGMYIINQNIDNIGELTIMDWKMDSNNNDLTQPACLPCFLKGGDGKIGRDYWRSTYNMGLSDGSEGLKAFAYITNYIYKGDYSFSYDSWRINISKLAGTDMVDNHEVKWQFHFVRRPRGANVLMGWHWEGDTPKSAEIISPAIGSYKMERINGGLTGTETYHYEIKFSDNVIHFFNEGGAFIKAVKKENGEVLVVTSGFPGLRFHSSGAVSSPLGNAMPYYTHYTSEKYDKRYGYVSKVEYTGFTGYMGDVTVTGELGAPGYGIITIIHTDENGNITLKKTIEWLDDDNQNN